MQTKVKTSSAEIAHSLPKVGEYTQITNAFNIHSDERQLTQGNDPEWVTWEKVN